MYQLQNKATSQIVDPRTDAAFPLTPADLGYDSWDEALAANREIDIIDGWAVVITQQPQEGP